MKIAYLTISSPNYYSQEFRLHDKYRKELEETLDEVGAQLEDVRSDIQSVEQFNECKDFVAETDAIVVMCGSFADGNIATQLATVDKPLILWSVEEECRSGGIKQHSIVTQCLFSSILHKCYDRSDVFCIYGSLNNSKNRQTLGDMLTAIKTRLKIRNSKVCQIGGEADGFLNLKEDEAALMAKFGMRIEKKSVSEVLEYAQRVEQEQVDEIVQREISQSTLYVDKVKLERTCRVYLALRRIAKENGYSALAVSCWPAFQDEYQITPCLAFSMLVEYDDVTVSCEGDLGGALTMMVLKELSDDKPSLMDITEIDVKRNSLLLWHCGFSPMSYCKGKYKVINHPMLNRKLTVDKRMGCSLDFVIDARKMTFARITGKQFGILYATGCKTNLSGRGFAGTRIWLNGLKLDGKPIKTADLMQTILINGVEHHFAICRKDISERIKLYSHLMQMHIIGE